MSRLRRTPVNFPKMKVRGRRNKMRLAMRLRYVTRLRVNLVPGGTSERIDFAADPKGQFLVEAAVVYDGFGRRVA